MERADYFQRWSALHGGYDPLSNALARTWGTVVYVAAKPLAAAQVSPHALTLLGVLAAAGAASLSRFDFRLALGAAILIAITGLLDALDGAVAILRDRVTPLGALVDSIADRTADLLFVLALWFAGAPAELCVAGGALMLLHEYVRTQSRSVGMRDIVIVTVWERPARVIVTAMFLFAYGLYDDTTWPTVGASAWVGLGLAGLGQLVNALAQRVR